MRLLYSIFRPVCNVITLYRIAQRYPQVGMFFNWNEHQARMHKKTLETRIAMPVAKVILSSPQAFAVSIYHELGHCLHEDGMCDDTLLAEYSAWAWMLDQVAVTQDLPLWGMRYNDVFPAFHYFATYCLNEENRAKSEGAMNSLQKLFTYYLDKA